MAQNNTCRVMESQIKLLQDSRLSMKTDVDANDEKCDTGKSINEREKWSNKIDFFFSGLGYSVGLSNVWRFPYLCYKYGGGAFLFAYYIGIIFASIPMLFLEILVGQYTSQGGPNTWNITPIFKGIGYTSAVMAFWCNLYYVILLAWSIYYLVLSFRSELPWATCGNWWNTINCVTPDEHNLNSSKSLISSVDEFWENNVLQATDSFDTIGSIRWELLICLGAAWVIVYFSLFKGIKWTGKVVYFTSTFPFVLIFIMLIRGVTLEGAWTGIKYLFIPDWNQLKSSEVWIEAITQGLYSYGLGLSAMTTLGSYNKFNNNSYREVLLLAVIGELTCLAAGIVIFSVLGFMSVSTGKDIAHVAAGGPGLAFIAYPSGLTQLPISPLWTVLFFLMLIFVAISSQFLGVEGFITACSDVWPGLRKRRASFLFFICFSSFVLGTIFVTQSGIYWFEIFNQYSCAGWALLTVVFFECIAISYGYGVNNFYENCKEMIGYYPGRFWKFCWAVATPGLCLGVFIFSIVKIEPFKLKDYVYPWYGEAIGWTLALSSISCIPIYAIYKVLTNLDDIKNIVRHEYQKKEIYVTDSSENSEV